MRSFSWLLPMLVAACGITPHADVQALVAAVSEAKLIAHVEALCAIGPRPEYDRRATAATLDLLETELRSYGYEPRREPFDALMQEWKEATAEDGTRIRVLTARQGVKHHNLIAEKRGQGPQAATVCELGAHFDSVPYGPGADDNGSGVAAVLEVARLCATVPTDKTIRFVFYAMEEEGLVGSKAHVEELVRQERESEAALVLDMVGFASSAPDSQQSPVRIPLLAPVPYVGDFILDAGNFSSGWLGNLFEACIDAYVPELPYFSVNRLAGWFADSARSDHASYWAAGIDAILLSDTAEMRNPHYHQASDLPATLDAVFLRRNTQAVLATMLHWAGRVPGDVPFAARARDP
ncbi:MAG TPA: M20/M25/M40 family metallo-hydrolase [Planctomycetota bacterium]